MKSHETEICVSMCLYNICLFFQGKKGVVRIKFTKSESQGT